MSFWRKTTLLASGFFLAACFMTVKPLAAQASSTIQLLTVSPDAEQIDTSQMQPPESVQLFAFEGTVGQEYDLQFSSTESPAVVIGINGDMTVEQNWSYDETTDIISVHLQYTGPTARSEDAQDRQPSAEEENPMAKAFMLAFVFAVEEGEDGPPAEMIGSWFTTNVQNWELVPPSPENPAFGYKLSGQPGTQGYFHMFIPDSMITLLGEMSGKELTVSDLAVFNGDDQSSLAVTAVEGGAMVEINVIFKETLNAVKRDPSSGHDNTSSLITKEITVQEQLPVSLTPNLSAVKRGKAVQLYGWVANGQPKTEVTIWKKLAHESEFTVVKKLRTKKNGLFKMKFKPKATATYKATYENLSSPQQTVTVK